jgi:thiol-disulfide isomerase/thioredoxin
MKHRTKQQLSSKIKLRYLFPLMLLISFIVPLALSAQENAGGQVYLEGYFPQYDSLQVTFSIWDGINKMGDGPDEVYKTAKTGRFNLTVPVDQIIKIGMQMWVNEERPIKHAFVSLGFFSSTAPLFEAGDSILMQPNPQLNSYDYNGMVFSGRGHEKLLILQELILQKKADAEKRKDFPSTLEMRLKDVEVTRMRIEKLIAKYEDKLSDHAKVYLRTEVLESLVGTVKIMTHLQAMGPADTTALRLYNAYIKPRPLVVDPVDISLLHSSIYMTVMHHRAFLDKTMESGTQYSPEYLAQHRNEWYQVIDETYSGLLKENMLAFYLLIYTKRGGYENHPELESCTLRFLASTSPTSIYHKQVKNVYDLFVNRIKPGAAVVNFNLQDTLGNSVQLSDLKGKIILFDFWFTGCPGCKQMTPFMEEIEERFRDSSNVVFVSVSIDRDLTRWKEGIGEYCSSEALPLYTEGKQKDHPVIGQFGISAYPTLVLLNQEGRIVNARAPDPRKDEGANLIRLIEELIHTDGLN